MRPVCVVLEAAVELAEGLVAATGFGVTMRAEGAGLTGAGLRAGAGWGGAVSKAFFRVGTSIRALDCGMG